MYILHVQYDIKPGKKEEFVAAVSEAGIDVASRAEAGCQQYDYFYAAQAEDQVLLVEVWDSQEAQQAHTNTAHFKKLGALKEQYVVNTTVTKYVGE